MEQQAQAVEVVVVGAGIMGSATAYALASRGVKVALCEQFDFLHSLGSSHGHSRIIRRSYPEPHYAEMMVRAYDLWAAAEKAAGYEVIVETGGLDVGLSDNAEMMGVIKTVAELGIEHEVLTPEQVKDRFPGVELGPNYVGVYSPEAGVVNATKATAMFQALALQAGALLRDRCEVQSIDNADGSPLGSPLGGSAGDLIVRTGRGTSFRCRRVVFTAGPWSREACRRLFHIDLPIQPVKISVPYWRCTEPETFNYDATQQNPTDRFPIFIHYGTPDLYALPVLEQPGQYKLCVHRGPDLDPTATDGSNKEPDWDIVRSDLVPVVDGTEAPDAVKLRGLAEWPSSCETCVYSLTPDHDFILDVLPRDPRVVIGAGFSGHGFKMGPYIGEVLADLAMGGAAREGGFQKHRHHFAIDRPALLNARI
jgi:sarcosine oxidase/L-pipecolate oxidase